MIQIHAERQVAPVHDRDGGAAGGGTAAAVTRLDDGNRLDLRIGAVRKNTRRPPVAHARLQRSIPGPVLHVDQGSQITVQVQNDGDVEATVHWHGLRLENRYDGVPDETEVRSGRRDIHLQGLVSPDAGLYRYHPHIREDFGLEIGAVRHDRGRLEPSDSGYWPAADRQLTLTLDDLLVEDGHSRPFRKSGPTFVAIGRYGNVMLINGETAFSGQATVGEVVRLYVVNTREHADLQLRHPRRARRAGRR